MLGLDPAASPGDVGSVGKCEGVSRAAQPVEGEEGSRFVDADRPLLDAERADRVDDKCRRILVLLPLHHLVAERDHGPQLLHLEGRREIDDVAARRQDCAVRALGPAHLETSEIGETRRNVEPQRVDALLAHQALRLVDSFQALVTPTGGTLPRMFVRPASSFSAVDPPTPIVIDFSPLLQRL